MSKSNHKEEMKDWKSFVPTWIGTMITILVLAITFSLRAGSYEQRIEANELDVIELYKDQDENSEEHREMIRLIYELQGDIKVIRSLLEAEYKEGDGDN
jgi:aspartate/glutamate racemase